MRRCRTWVYLLCCLLILQRHAQADDPAALVTLKLTHPPANPAKNLRPVSLLEFSADASCLLAATDETATLWNLATRKPAFDSPPRRPGPNPGGINVFATGGGAFFVITEGKGTFTLRDATTGAARGPARFPPQQASGFPIVPETVISRDGKWMACAFNNHPWGAPQGVVNGKPLPLEPSRVIMFDARTGAPRHTWTPRAKPPLAADPAAAPQPPQDAPVVFALAFSPDGHYLATATTDGKVTAFDTAGGRETGSFNAWDERKRLAPTPREFRQDMFTWTDDSKSLIMPATLQHEQTPCWTVAGQSVRDLHWPAETTAIPNPPSAPAPPSRRAPTCRPPASRCASRASI